MLSSMITWMISLQICKDKVEAEVWLAGLKALILPGQQPNRRTKSDIFEVSYKHFCPEIIVSFSTIYFITCFYVKSPIMPSGFST